MTNQIQNIRILQFYRKVTFFGEIEWVFFLLLLFLFVLKKLKKNTSSNFFTAHYNFFENTGILYGERGLICFNQLLNQQA